MVVKVVHTVNKTHFDFGFTNSAGKVLHDYINWKFGVAVELHAKLKDTGYGNVFSWTLPTCLLWEALERKKGAERKKLEKAIEDRVFEWTASAFTPNTEFMDEDLFGHSLSIAKELDNRFGRNTIAAKFTDVPGNTVGMLKILNEFGIKFVQIGVNWASPVPDVPPEFLWQDGRGNEAIVMYSSGYGDTRQFPGTGSVLNQVLRGDNMEVPSYEEVLANYNKVCSIYKAENPDVIIGASTYSDFARDVMCVKDELPVYTGEIGDSWIYGVASDPKKVAGYRELMRLKDKWLNMGIIRKTDEEYKKFAYNLMLVAEHTWGVSHMEHLMDNVNINNVDFHRVRHRGNYKTLEASWEEQRDYLELAVDSLCEELNKEGRKAVSLLEPQKPDLSEYEKLLNVTDIEIAGYSVSFDRKTGAINGLISENAGILADAGHLLGKFLYQMIPAEEVERYGSQYWTGGEFSAPKEPAGRYDNVKPRYADLSSVEFYRKAVPRVVEIIAVILPDKDAVINRGAPETVYIKYTFRDEERYIDFELSWFDKTATRYYEACWFCINPVPPKSYLPVMDKMGMPVSPLNVVKDGSGNLHSVLSGVYYSSDGELNDSDMRIETLDACLLSPGKPNLTDYNNEKPDMSEGWSFNLYNNFWRTNYTAWYDEDAKFRFRLYTGINVKD